MIFEDCRYDARKSRELVNMKILVSLDKFCLSYSDGFYSVSQSATYQQISTGTSCYNFSLKKTIGACSHRYVSFFIWKIFRHSGSHPRAEKKTTETDYFLHRCFNSTCMIYKLSNLLAKFFFSGRRYTWCPQLSIKLNCLSLIDRWHGIDRVMHYL